jgi:hypothetical protein
LAFKPPFPRGLSWLAGGQVSWLPGIGRPQPSRGLSVVPSGPRIARPWRPSPGHSGGTAPVSHRTSLDHRPSYVGESIRCDPVTTRPRNFSIQRTTRAPSRPSVALCSPKSKTRSRKRSALARSSVRRAQPESSPSSSQSCWGNPIHAETNGSCGERSQALPWHRPSTRSRCSFSYSADNEPRLDSSHADLRSCARASRVDCSGTHQDWRPWCLRLRLSRYDPVAHLPHVARAHPFFHRSASPSKAQRSSR